MAELIMRRIGDRLAPVDMDGFELLSKINAGKDVKVTVTQSRNLAFHRMFMAAVKHLFDMRDDYSVYDEFRKDVTIKLGHFTVETVRGKPKAIAKSISFASMDNTAFSEFFSDFALVAYDICPQMTRGQIEKFNEILDGNSGALGHREVA